MIQVRLVFKLFSEAILSTVYTVSVDLLRLVCLVCLVCHHFVHLVWQICHILGSSEVVSYPRHFRSRHLSDAVLFHIRALISGRRRRLTTVPENMCGSESGAESIPGQRRRCCSSIDSAPGLHPASVWIPHVHDDTRDLSIHALYDGFTDRLISTGNRPVTFSPYSRIYGGACQFTLIDNNIIS